MRKSQSIFSRAELWRVYLGFWKILYQLDHLTQSDKTHQAESSLVYIVFLFYPSINYKVLEEVRFRILALSFSTF